MNSAFSPRIVGCFRPDFHCLESMLGSPQFAGRQGEDLVMAVYNHLTSQVDGTYHWWPSAENEGQPRVRRVNTDPIKIINAYGWAICGQMSHILYAIWTTAGTAAGLKARLYGLPGHALCEVNYDGRWHHYDVDMWSWFRTPAGHVASAYELSQNARALIFENQNKSKPCNLPDRDLEGYANMYSKAEVANGDIASVRPDWMDRSHNMDFYLRPGETILRTSENQGRFVMPKGWLTFKKDFEKEWHGNPRERYAPFRTFGNGRWIYEPNLTEKYRDVAAGVWEKKGVRQRSLRAQRRGPRDVPDPVPVSVRGHPGLEGCRHAGCQRRVGRGGWPGQGQRGYHRPRGQVADRVHLRQALRREDRHHQYPQGPLRVPHPPDAGRRGEGAEVPLRGVLHGRSDQPAAAGRGREPDGTPLLRQARPADGAVDPGG